MRTRFRIAIGLALVVGLSLAACGSGSSEWTPLPSGAEPPAACARADADGVIEISADQLRFSAPCMVAPAGEAFMVRLTNRETAPHNVAIFADQTTATTYFEGEHFSGPDVTKEYEVEALAAGDYYFNCTLHPADMQGALYVR